MARNKESLLLLLDVGSTMHKALPEIEKVCSMLVQKKLIYSKSDEVGIVLFGTEETNNDLTREVGGYEHVAVLRNIKVVDGDLVEALQRLPRGTVAGDFLDAIVVGMDMLIKKFGPTNKGKKHLCLITSAQCPIKEPYEGTKKEQVNTIAVQMTAHGMRMDCVVVRGKLIRDGDKKVMDENDVLLSLFSKKTCAKTVHVETPTSLRGALRTRNILPVTLFRGDLELSPMMKIKVWVYKKTAEERFPTLKIYSDKAPPTDKFATHEVKVDFEYKRVQGPGKVVPPEQRIKGYRYGPQVIPISSADWEAVKFKPEKSVRLLGFTDAANIMRHYYMKDVNIFIAEPGNTKAILAVSAIARAMKEMNKVAILRCVWRQGRGNVVIGVLTPNVSDEDNVPDCFYFNVLPFAEDIREFQFPSFSNCPSSWQPNEEQQEAADNLVKMLDLAPLDKKEALQPDFTPNPVLERFYHHLELKSKYPDAAVPPLDVTLKMITEPDSELFSQNKTVIDAFCRHFEVKENPKLKKSTKRLMSERPSGSNGEKQEFGAINDAQMGDSINNTSMVMVEKIGNSTPVQDFEAMMARRDNPEWVSKAIKDMKNKVFDLVEDSYEGDNYDKALECLVALRKGCILEQEPKLFNDFLHHICRFCQEKDLNSFCQLLVSKGIILITKREALDSEVTEDEARSFIGKTEPKF
ncbi:ATP-dependent DNA helicase 2 subunit KU80 isoform X2 [Malania oleifera]|uniref:ATP-dependent DNA helicase 2 subunit KU80 isoform X2 n=2 Tax=Malania oleifera TaxID=397392 RepID=UPI0025AEC33C|nr:ATP-dependent DNA helicase 2 subunit KU80 isoform X2 [Malania oleifera]XP_057980917.1 ATP-dependent DNA helicase 2 subunit KU80 isoform X2 [Malania oleifera]